MRRPRTQGRDTAPAQVATVTSSRVGLPLAAVHPHIAPVWAVFVDSTELGILMPMARHGSLSQRAGDLHQDEGVVARYMVWPILSAVCHIHARGIVHRDIKRENILIDARGSVLVSDFSFATECSRPPVSFVGTQCAMSPELIFSGCPPNPESPLRVNVPHDQRTPYGRSVDVWALGVLTYELVTGTRESAPSHAATALLSIPVFMPRPRPSSRHRRPVCRHGLPGHGPGHGCRVLPQHGGLRPPLPALPGLHRQMPRVGPQPPVPR